jgi:O-antigen ligase
VAAVTEPWARGRRAALFAAAGLLSAGYILLALPVAALCWLAEARSGKPWWEPLPLDRLLFAWAALVLVSAAFSPYPHVALGGSALLLLSPVLGVGPWLRTVRERPSDLLGLIGAWTIGGAAAGAWVILSYVGNPRGRGELPALGFNAAGTSLLMASLLGLTLAVTPLAGRWRKVGAAAQLPVIVGLLATASRGAWLGWILGVSVLLVVVALWARGLAPRVLAAMTVLAAAAGIALATQPALADRVASIASVERNLSRVQTWTRAIEMIRDRPLLGHGFSAFGYAFETYRKPGDIDRHPPFAHNAFLNSAAETGLPATLLWIAFLAAVFWLPLRRASRETPAAASLRGGLAATLAGLLGQQLVDGTLQAFHFAFAFWFLYASLFGPMPRGRA